MNKYTIELKLDAPAEHQAAMTEIVKQYARDILASAMLLSGNRTPKIICRSEDSFYTTEEIEFLEPSENVHKPEDV